jgi:hypothetical protein
MNAMETHRNGRSGIRKTWAEIRAEFPSEWVVLAEVDWANDTDMDFGSARVIGHHTGRAAAWMTAKAAFAEYSDLGCFWTGEIRGRFPRFVL